MARYKEIHVYDKEGSYIGNIMYNKLHGVPQMSEEEFVDLIIEHFPQLKGKAWMTKFI